LLPLDPPHVDGVQAGPDQGEGGNHFGHDAEADFGGYGRLEGGGGNEEVADTVDEADYEEGERDEDAVEELMIPVSLCQG
jgi:hypothetical protein